MKKINDKGFMISTLIYGIFIMFIILLSALIVTLNYRKNAFSDINIPGENVEPTPSEKFISESDLDGLIPVKYVDYKGDVVKESGKGEWVITTWDDPDWYNYNDGRWANAVHLLKNYSGSKDPNTVLNLTRDVRYIYVWIPRYEYTIGCLNGSTECKGYNGKIDVNFISKEKENENNNIPRYIYDETNVVPDNWYVHPAFDGNSPGFWVSKYDLKKITNCDNAEASDINTTCNDKFNYMYVNTSLEGAEVLNGRFSTIVNNLGDSNIPGNFMISNSEWTAVEYLEKSKYSTNNNVYGVYSINNCDKWHYVLGFFKKLYPSKETFGENIDNMDIFDINNIADEPSLIMSENTGLIGHGFFEVVPFNKNAYNPNGDCTNVTTTIYCNHYPLVVRKNNFVFSFAPDFATIYPSDFETHYLFVKK